MNHFIKFIKALFILCIFPFAANSQNVAINTSSNVANSAAILDLSDASNNSFGFAMPNVSIGNANSASPVSSPPVGLIVYNTNGAMVGGGGSETAATGGAGANGIIIITEYK